MGITTVNRLSPHAIRAFEKVCEEDGNDWLEIETYNGKIGVYDTDDDKHMTLKEGLEEFIAYADYTLEEYDLTDEELDAITSLCDLLHVEY